MSQATPSRLSNLLTLETVSGALVFIVGLGCGHFQDDWSVHSLPFWQAITGTGVGLLFIGLVRDLYLMARARVSGIERSNQRAQGEKPICVESMVGSILVASGLGILLLGVQHDFHPSTPTLLLGAGTLLVISGLIKDLVMVFKVEKDHGNVILW